MRYFKQFWAISYIRTALRNELFRINSGQWDAWEKNLYYFFLISLKKLKLLQKNLFWPPQKIKIQKIQKKTTPPKFVLGLAYTKNIIKTLLNFFLDCKKKIRPPKHISIDHTAKRNILDTPPKMLHPKKEKKRRRKNWTIPPQDFSLSPLHFLHGPY